jgi:hypothetical protein
MISTLGKDPMPFTPFHFGPGAAVKALFPRSFSFSVFCAAQVITDVEPGYFLLRGEYPVHRWAHTYLGALGVAALTLAIAGPLVRWLHPKFAAFPKLPLSRWIGATDLSWRVIAVSALVGTLSHVLLDSVMHADVRPFAPFSASNPFLGAVGFVALHYGCIACGLIAYMYASFCAPKSA